MDPRLHLITGSNAFPSGYVKIAIENWPFLVSFPIENDDLNHSYVKFSHWKWRVSSSLCNKLPEGLYVHICAMVKTFDEWISFWGMDPNWESFSFPQGLGHSPDPPPKLRR